MDTITQGLLGAASAQLGFRQRIGRDATWAAAVAGVVPDLDIFLAPLLSLTGAEVGEMGQTVLHRGLSHSLLAVPVLSVPLAAAWWCFRRRAARRQARAADADAATWREPPGGQANPPREPPGFLWLYACVFVAMLTHGLLDWCTSYGTQLLAPITTERFAIDAVPIVDILYTPLLVVTLLACRLIRRARGGRAVRATLAIGWLGMALSVGYLAAGRVLHDLAVEKALDLVGRRDVVRADAYPMIGTIFLWRTVVETDEAWHVARIHHFAAPAPAGVRRTTVAKAAPNEWVRRAWEVPDARTFDWFTMHRTRVTCARQDGRHVVELHDMRYGREAHSAESLWALRVTFGADGQVLDVERVHHFRRARRLELIARAWRDIWNP